VLACITCENIVLLTTKPEILREEAQTTNLFLPTVCESCEKDEWMMGPVGSRIGSARPLWTSLSISHDIIRMWQPFLKMAFPEGLLSASKTNVKLVQRDEVRHKVESDYIVQSVDCSTGHRVEVHPYLLSGFF
jgi:hypothetical protein